jgi:hypothetical protein
MSPLPDFSGLEAFLRLAAESGSVPVPELAKAVGALGLEVLPERFGDVLVLRQTQEVSLEAAKRIRAHVLELIPEARLIVVDGGADIAPLSTVVTLARIEQKLDYLLRALAEEDDGPAPTDLDGGPDGAPREPGSAL